MEREPRSSNTACCSLTRSACAAFQIVLETLKSESRDIDRLLKGPHCVLGGVEPIRPNL